MTASSADDVLMAEAEPATEEEITSATDVKSTTIATPAVVAEVVEEAVALFYSAFHLTQQECPRSSLTIACAPGRVNLIGEHTDYNDGFVLPLALDKTTVVVGRRAPLDSNNKSTIVSLKFPGQIVEFEATAALEAPGVRSQWGNYVKGVTAMYARHTKLPAMNVQAAIASRVPFGSGLSSSAALEVSFATFLESVFQLQANDEYKISLTQKALLCQKAEHEFCNVPCGIMDQFISSCGQDGCALLIDCRTREATKVPFVDPEVVILVSNSNVNHELSGSEYKDRVSQCKEAVKVLQQQYPNITHLRDATMDQLNVVKSSLSELVYRRARHVITENERTVAMMALVNAHKYKEAGELMFASHQSLKDDYEVSTPQLDALVEIARASPGVYGARMTGGGFGGCIVVLLRRANAAELMAKLDEGYPTELFGDHSFPTPTSFVTQIGHGAQVLQVGEQSTAASLL